VTHTHVAAAEDGTAALTIDGLGEGVSDAYIGVVPLGEIGEVGASWSWSASVVPGDTGAPEDTDLPDDTGAPDTGDDGTGGGGKEPKGQGEDETDCGCAAGGAAPGAVWLAAVALGAVTRRRRRSW
jgi:MYXO-CTERM domain-containing protein